MNFPIQFRVGRTGPRNRRDGEQNLQGLKQLTSMTDEDVDIGSTPKDVFYARETFQVYRYKRMVDDDKIHPVPMICLDAADQRLRGLRTCSPTVPSSAIF